MSEEITRSVEPNLAEGWNESTSPLNNSPIVDRLIQGHSMLKTLAATDPGCLPGSTDCSPDSKSTSAEKISPNTWSNALSGPTNASWFRMAAHCYRVDSLRDSDLQTASHTHPIPGKWSTDDVIDHVNPSSRDWTLDVAREPTDQFSPLMTEIKFDSNSGPVAADMAKFLDYGNQSHTGSYDAEQLSKSTEHMNVHHTLRDVINSSLDASSQGGSDTRRIRDELSFTAQKKEQISCSSNRLPVTPPRGPSLTVKIQMPLEDRSMYSDSGHSSFLTHQFNGDLGNKHAHVKKPLNAFMLFMKEKRAQVMAECTLKESAAINQILGRKWHALSREEQAKYYGLARVEKERHQRMYPGWSARDNYACQVKRRKKRSLREHARYTSKSIGISARIHNELTKSSLVPGPSMNNKPLNALISGSDGSMHANTTQSSRLIRSYSNAINNSLYSSIPQSVYTNDPNWTTDPFRQIAHNAVYEFHTAADAYLRPELSHSLNPVDSSTNVHIRSATDMEPPPNTNPVSCCPGCPERISPFDEHVHRSNRIGYDSSFMGLDKITEDIGSRSLKIVPQQDDRRSPCLYSLIRGNREDSTLKLQTKESMFYHPSTQWHSEASNLDAACARITLPYGDRSIRPHCAPVPDLLQSTRGSTNFATRFSRSTSPSNQSLTDALASPSTAISQTNLNNTDRSQVVATVAAAAAAAAFTLKASSLANSEMTPAYCYETHHYSPEPYQAVQNMVGELGRTALATHGPLERDLEAYDKKNRYISLVQNQDN